MTCTERDRRSFLRRALGAVLGVLCYAAPSWAANYGYHRGHNCPRCGNVVTRINSFAGRYHWHRCGSSPGTFWFHESH